MRLETLFGLWRLRRLLPTLGPLPLVLGRSQSTIQFAVGRAASAALLFSKTEATGEMWFKGQFAQQAIVSPHVRFGSEADIGADAIDVRFTPKSGHWLSVP
jgi:hypothetical protein